MTGSSTSITDKVNVTIMTVADAMLGFGRFQGKRAGRLVTQTISAQRGPTPIPAASALAVDIEADFCHHDRIFELDEAALGMLQRGLNRPHHAALERTRRVVSVVGHRAGAGEAWRLVTDQPHAVRQEMQVVVQLRLGE